MDDLKLKVGSPEEAAWTKVLKSQEEAVLNTRINLKIAETLIKLATKRIAEEKEKFKK